MAKLPYGYGGGRTGTRGYLFVESLIGPYRIRITLDVGNDVGIAVLRQSSITYASSFQSCLFVIRQRTQTSL